MLPVVNVHKPTNQKLEHATESVPQLNDVLMRVRAVNVLRGCLEVNEWYFMWHDVSKSSKWSWVLGVGILQLYKSEMQIFPVLLDLFLQDDMCNVGGVEKKARFNTAGFFYKDFADYKLLRGWFFIW